MRKLISLLSAASIVATSFVAVTTAQAAGETVLYSNSFNGYETSLRAAGGSVFAGSDNGQYSSVAGLADWQWIFDAPPSQTLDKLTVGNASGDDTAVFMIGEKEENAADKYLQTRRNRFPARAKPTISGFDAYEAKDGEDLVIAFDLMLVDTDAALAASKQASVEFMSGETSLGTIDTSKVTSGEWVKVKAVTSDGTTTIFINDDEYISDAPGAISAIRPEPLGPDGDNRITANWYDYPQVNIDELVILSAANGAEADIPAADDEKQQEEEEAAPFDTEATVNFDDKTIEAAGFEERTGSKSGIMTTTSVVDDDEMGSQVWEVVQISDKSANNEYGYAKIDFSSVTEGKSHIGISYDVKIGNSGRLRVIIGGEFNGSAADGLPSLFAQGITKSGDSGIVNCKLDEWVHTDVDVNLATGKGSYKVTSVADDSVIGQGKFETAITEVTSISLVSWSPNTSYLDNLVVKAGGGSGIVLATPEPASEVPGGDLKLYPEDATWINDLGNAGTDYEAVLNHSDAQKLAAADGINAYEKDVNVRGKSIYAAYDVYITPGSSMEIVATGDGGKAVTSTLMLTTNKDNTVNVSAKGKDDVITSAKEKLVADTWYRVLIEVPQSGTAEAPVTDNLTYTIYRINADDPSQVTEIAAQMTDLTARGAATKAITAFNVTANGDVYVDNSAIFIYATGFSYYEAPPTEVTPEPAGAAEGSGIDLAPEGAEKYDISDAEGDPIKVLNHSEAKPVVNASNMNALFDKARDNSVYVAYDVLVEKGATVELVGANGSSVGPQLKLIADEYGAVTVAAVKDSKTTVTAKETLAAGTWYRVVAEFPQLRTEENTTATGSITYTVYRINGTDPTKTAGVAAKLTDLGARNLADRSLTGINLTAEGTAYIDNGVIYLAAAPTVTYTKYTATYSDDGRLTNVESEAIDNPTADDVVLTGTTRTFVWASTGEPFVG